MYKIVYCKPDKKIKVPATDLIMYKKGYKPEELLAVFLEEAKRCYCTSMRFPSRVVSVREQKVQRQNYDFFVNTMAELMKKYASEITE